MAAVRVTDKSSALPNEPFSHFCPTCGTYLLREGRVGRTIFSSACSRPCYARWKQRDTQLVLMSTGIVTTLESGGPSAPGGLS